MVDFIDLQWWPIFNVADICINVDQSFRLNQLHEVARRIPEDWVRESAAVGSVDECAARTVDLLADPVGADAMGTQGKEHVRANFLSTRELEDWLRLLTELRG